MIKRAKNIILKLGFLKKHGFYMAGGTALALQIKHRISYDFDFYTENRFVKLKYKGQFNEYAALRGMGYFDDAEKDIEEGKFKIKKREWFNIKKIVWNETNNYVKKTL